MNAATANWFSDAVPRSSRETPTRWAPRSLKAVDSFKPQVSTTLLVGNFLEFHDLGYWLGRQRAWALTDLVSGLKKLEGGWAGEDSLAPKESVLADIASALGRISWQLTEPEAEVDCDGSVALLWCHGEQTFALTFKGGGKVIGTMSPQARGYEPWALGVNEARELLAKLKTEEVAPFVL